MATTMATTNATAARYEAGEVTSAERAAVVLTPAERRAVAAAARALAGRGLAFSVSLVGAADGRVTVYYGRASRPGRDGTTHMVTFDLCGRCRG